MGVRSRLKDPKPIGDSAFKVRPSGLAETIDYHDRLIRTRQWSPLGTLKVIKFSLDSIPLEKFNDDNFYIKTKRPDGKGVEIELDFGDTGNPPHLRQPILVATNATQSEVLFVTPMHFPAIPDPTFVAPDPIYEKRDAEWGKRNPRLVQEAIDNYKRVDAQGNPAPLGSGNACDGSDTGVIMNKEERKTPFIAQPFQDLVWGSVPAGKGSDSKPRTALVFQLVRWILIEYATGPIGEQGYRSLRFHADGAGKHPTFIYLPSSSPAEPNRGYLVYGNFEVETPKAGADTAAERADDRVAEEVFA